MMLKAEVCVCAFAVGGGGPRLQTNCRGEMVPQVRPPPQGPWRCIGKRGALVMWRVSGQGLEEEARPAVSSTNEPLGSQRL